MESGFTSPDPILIGYDGSDGARRAIDAAARLIVAAPAVVAFAWHPLSSVLLWNPLIPSPGPLAEPAAELDAAGKEAAQQLANEGAAYARAVGLDAMPGIAAARHGAGAALLAAADDAHAQLIVLGAHGTSAVGSRLCGSVATHVLHHSTRPVLVVPLAERAP